jgi:hypothetical protein
LIGPGQLVNVLILGVGIAAVVILQEVVVIVRLGSIGCKNLPAFGSIVRTPA